MMVACLISSACVPALESYERIEVPDARYLRSVCYASTGTPSVVYYPYHGIFISLDVTSWVSLGLHLPAGTTAQLNGNTVHISGTAKTGPVDAIIPIRAARQGSLGGRDPLEFRKLSDPYTSADNFGPLTGDTHDGKYQWYFFISASSDPQPRLIPSPPDLLRGTVELPSITINGQRYEPQSIPFERHVSAFILPVNC